VDKRRRLVVILACFFCIVLLGNLTRSGAFERIRAVDLVSLLAAGILAGVALVQLMSARKG
jgi:hypothetical protein